MQNINAQLTNPPVTSCHDAITDVVVTLETTKFEGIAGTAKPHLVRRHNRLRDVI